jgi:hypothetical protein
MCFLQYTGSSSYTDQQNSAKYNSSAALNKYGWYPQVGCLLLRQKINQALAASNWVLFLPHEA